MQGRGGGVYPWFAAQSSTQRSGDLLSYLVEISYSSSGWNTGTVICTFEGLRFEDLQVDFSQGKKLRWGGETGDFFNVCSARSLRMLVASLPVYGEFMVITGP